MADKKAQAEKRVQAAIERDQAENAEKAAAVTALQEREAVQRLTTDLRTEAALKAEPKPKKSEG